MTVWVRDTKKMVNVTDDGPIKDKQEAPTSEQEPAHNTNVEPNIMDIGPPVESTDCVKIGDYVAVKQVVGKRPTFVYMAKVLSLSEQDIEVHFVQRSSTGYIYKEIDLIGEDDILFKTDQPDIVNAGTRARYIFTGLASDPRLTGYVLK